MEEFSEDQIWDTITAHAKGKIDYEAFAAFFHFEPDNFLSSIIYGFAVNRSVEVIADKIAAQVTMTGNAVDKAALSRFIEQSEPALQQEIGLTIRVLGMLNDGEEPRDVYGIVLEVLDR